MGRKRAAAASSKGRKYEISAEDHRLLATLAADEAYCARKHAMVDTALMRMSSIVYDSEILDTVLIMEALFKLTRNLRFIVETAVTTLEAAPATPPDVK